MKRPKCMEKRILDDVPVVNICPKCGGYWVEHGDCELDGCPFRNLSWCVDCGHEEKLKP